MSETETAPDLPADSPAVSIHRFARSRRAAKWALGIVGGLLLLLVAALVVVAVVHPAGINVSRLQPDAGVAQTVIAGFVALARWLVAAHAVALVLVALRLRVSQARAATRRRVASA